MKPFRATTRWLALVAGSLALTASAQPEQWLQYHTSAEPRGYRWLDLTTNPPPNLILAKLQAPPQFARWTTPLDPAGGRWVCFDRTRRSGPYDRLFIDANGNGRLDDEQPVAAVRRDSYSAYFDPVRVVFQGEDGPVTYHLIFRFSQYDRSRAQALVSSGCWYEGMVDLAGKKRRVQLLDNTVNGTFNDAAANPEDSDRIAVDGEKGFNRYLGRLLEVDKQLFQIEVARDGAFVKLKKADNVALGTVRVPETIAEFTAAGEPGHFTRKPARGEFTLPVGKYKLQSWTIERKDDKGAAWQLSGDSFGDKGRFDVMASEPTRLAIGEPVLVKLNASQSKAQFSFDLKFGGLLDESVEISRSKERARAPQLTLASADGAYRKISSFQYG